MTLYPLSAAHVIAAPPAEHAAPAALRAEPLSARHLPGLDGVRGLAVLGVMLVHYLDHVGASGPVGRLLFGVIDSAWVGVDLFFVLSGFLITGILLDTRGEPHYFRNFYARRALRIVPLYAAALLVFLVAWPAVRPYEDPQMRDALANQGWLWLYGSNVLTAWRNAWSLGAFNHFWTLAVEEHFYLVWPAVVLACGPRTLARVCVGLIVAAAALRVGFAYASPYPLAAHVLTPCRMDALAAGALLAIAARSGGGLRAAAPLVLGVGATAAVALVAAALRYGPLGGSIPLFTAVGYTLVAAAAAAVVLLAATAGDRTPVSRVVRLAPLRAAGRYSYGLYVFHLPLQELVVDPVAPLAAIKGVIGYWPSLAAYVLINAAVSLLVAAASWHLFERHFLRLKDRFGGPGATDARTG